VRQRNGPVLSTGPGPGSLAPPGVPRHDAHLSRHVPAASWPRPLTTRSGWQTRSPRPSVGKNRAAPGGPGLLCPGRLTCGTRNGTSSVTHGLPLRPFAVPHEPKRLGTAGCAHHRMPVILTKELEDAWIDPELTKTQDALDILSRSTGLELDAYPVSRMVNKPSVDRESLIQRVE
jgi:SOS response associated peptidase (SRAP)